MSNWCVGTNFKSSKMMKNEDLYEYFVNLNFTMVTNLDGRQVSFGVTNGIDEIVHNFTLQLKFEPEFHEKINIKNDKSGFVLQVMFKSNPKPSYGQWTLGNVTIPSGTGKAL